MNQINQHDPYQKPRLNPFIFPSDTDFSFALLLIVVISATVFIYDWIHAGQATDFADQVLACFQSSGVREAVEIEAITQAQSTFNACLAPTYRQNLYWIFGGLGIVFTLAAGILFIQPYWKIKRDKLIPLTPEDAPDVCSYLEGLCAELDLTHSPKYYWDPLSRSTSGVVFGHPGRKFVALGGGLVVQFYSDQPAFRAVMYHEIAHLYNKDVNKTYFTVALWRAFVAAALIPMAFNLIIGAPRSLFQNLPVIAQLSLRALVLAVLVYLIRNAVLRVREYYADVRADVWLGAGSELRKVIGSLPTDLRRLKLLRLHPTPEQRQRVLDDTLPLFSMGLAAPLATGIAAGIAFRNLERLFTMLLTSSERSHMAGFGAALLTVPWIVGVVGLGIWRQLFADNVRQPGFYKLLPFITGLWIGTLLGNALAFEAYTLDRLTETDLLNRIGVGFVRVIWALLLLLLLYLFLRWVQSSAQVWLEVSTNRRFLRRAYIVVLTITGIVMAAWFGPVMSLSKFSGSVEEAFFAVAVDLGALFTLVSLNPLTILFWISIWIVPLASWFWRQRRANISGLPRAFLPPLPPEQRDILNRPVELKPMHAAGAGALTGLFYGGLLTIARLGLYLMLSELLRGSDQYKLISFMVSVIIAVIFQIILAVIVAAWAPRLGVLHGMCAAFTASLVMAVGFLIVNGLFGGVIDLEFTGTVLSSISNYGALLVLSITLVSTPLIHAARRAFA